LTLEAQQKGRDRADSGPMSIERLRAEGKNDEDFQRKRTPERRDKIWAEKCEKRSQLEWGKEAGKSVDSSKERSNIENIKRWRNKRDSSINPKHLFEREGASPKNYPGISPVNIGRESPAINTVSLAITC